MRKFSIVTSAFLFFTFILPAFAQEKLKTISNETDAPLRCADTVVIEFSKVQKLKRFEGKVGVENSLEAVSAIIEIYESSKLEFKTSATKIVEEKKPIKRIKTDESGESYFDKLSEGYYVLKIGTDDGGFCCDFMKIKIATNASHKPLRIKLSLGA